MKKIIAGALCAALCAGAKLAYAAEFSEVPTVDYVNGTVTIKVPTDGKKSVASVLILNPGKKVSDIGADGAAIQNQRNVEVKDGIVEYTFKIHNGTMGDYSVYVDGEAAYTTIGEDKLYGFFYADSAAREGIINAMTEAAKKETADDMITCLEDENTQKVLGITAFTPYIESKDKNGIAANLCTLIANQKFENQKIEEMTDKDKAMAALQTVVKQAYILQAYQNSQKTIVFSADGGFNYDAELGISGIDKTYSVTLIDTYSNYISEAGKSAIRESLLGKEYKNTDEFSRELMKQIALIGAVNGKDTGYAHAEKILTADNMKVLGLTGTPSAAVAMHVAGYTSPFASIEALQTAINSTPTSGGGDNKHYSSGGGGGGSSSGEKTYYPDMSNVTNQTQSTSGFSDIDGYAWAKEAITALSQKGIVNGVSSDKFAPESLVTREQFIKLLTSALGLSGTATDRFSDVSPDAWYAPYVGAAVENNLVSGISETEFGIGKYITRQDIMTILFRTLDNPEAAEPAFADNADIADYAYEAVGTLSKLKIVNGYSDNTVRPRNTCTRAEAAVIIHNYMNTVK